LVLRDADRFIYPASVYSATRRSANDRAAIRSQEHVTFQSGVIEEKVNKNFIFGNFQSELPTYKGKSESKL